LPAEGGKTSPRRAWKAARDFPNRAVNALKGRVAMQMRHWHERCFGQSNWRENVMDPIFGIHESTLLFRAQRLEVLSANLANADTPNFKARDIEFSYSMSSVADGTRMIATHARHIAPTAAGNAGDLRYRNPFQPSLDGNTVESDLELARFAENSVMYQASLLFLNGRIAGLRSAITGGR
jgi:flagellar basal-body rod protein FlgB